MNILPVDILRARKRLEGVVRRTPLTRSGFLSESSGAEVYLKWENQQETGSFKVRGAYHMIASLPPEERERGLVTASAGNHGAAVAFVAHELGARATIVVPRTASEFKVARIREYGAEVIVEGDSYDDSLAFARDMAARLQMVFVSATDDPAIMAGQGTIAVEILEELPEASTLVVPIGGAGLIVGMAIWAKAVNPSLRVVGVQSTAARTAYEGFRARRVVEVPVEATLADGLAGGISSQNLTLLLQYVDDVVLTEEGRLQAAIRQVWNQEGQVIEGSAAVGPAALLQGSLRLRRGETTAMLISGGNLDPAVVRIS